MCLWVMAEPIKGAHFYLYFDILLILVQNAESAKNFQVQNFMVYGSMHHALTKKKVLGYRLTSLENSDIVPLGQLFSHI